MFPRRKDFKRRRKSKLKPAVIRLLHNKSLMKASVETDSEWNNLNEEIKLPTEQHGLNCSSRKDGIVNRKMSPRIPISWWKSSEKTKFSLVPPPVCKFPCATSSSSDLMVQNRQEYYYSDYFPQKCCVTCRHAKSPCQRQHSSQTTFTARWAGAVNDDHLAKWEDQLLAKFKKQDTIKTRDYSWHNWKSRRLISCKCKTFNDDNYRGKGEPYFYPCQCHVSCSCQSTSCLTNLSQPADSSLDSSIDTPSGAGFSSNLPPSLSFSSIKREPHPSSSSIYMRSSSFPKPQMSTFSSTYTMLPINLHCFQLIFTFIIASLTGFLGMRPQVGTSSPVNKILSESSTSQSRFKRQIIKKEKTQFIYIIVFGLCLLSPCVTPVITSNDIFSMDAVQPQADSMDTGKKFHCIFSLRIQTQPL